MKSIKHFEKIEGMFMKKISRLGELKFEILSSGIQLQNRIKNTLSKISKEPQSMRSGISSGIELILPEDIWVNAPVKEHFTRKSPLLLDMENESIVLKKRKNIITHVTTLPRPAFYDKHTSDGIPMKKIGSIRADRLSIGINDSCIFWADKNLRCKFCAIGHNPESRIAMRTLSQVMETIGAALNDPIRPCKHLYLSGGALPGEDRGISLYSTYIKEIKENFDLHIHLNPMPPKDVTAIDSLFKAGLDEISFNIEVFDELIALEMIPGKYRAVPRSQYTRSLDYAVDLFGEKKVSSCLVIGLEDVHSAVDGVEFLVSRGVIPKLSIFRPIIGSLLQGCNPPDLHFLLEVYHESEEIAKEYGLPLGPLCIPCQMHSLVIPKSHEDYFHF